MHLFQTGCAQLNDLILKDTPSYFLLKPHAAVMCLDCGHCLGCVVVTVILVVCFWKDSFGMQDIAAE